jgi:AbrB family looped-hinge helix DNA binding protein
MEFVLRVSPKGQVVLPKKLRDSLEVKDLVSIEIKDDTAIVRKADLSSERLAGCFKGYAAKKKVTTKKAIERATKIVAHETAGQGH